MQKFDKIKTKNDWQNFDELIVVENAMLLTVRKIHQAFHHHFFTRVL